MVVRKALSDDKQCHKLNGDPVPFSKVSPTPVKHRKIELQMLAKIFCKYKNNEMKILCALPYLKGKM